MVQLPAESDVRLARAHLALTGLSVGDAFGECFFGRDTTCAMVGGVVALAVGTGGVPPGWLAAREPLLWRVA